MPAPTPQAAVCVRDLVVKYGSRRAVDGLSFEAAEGEVLALVGPNGAGKTSAVEACVGLRQPHGGSIEVLGTSDLGSPALRARVGVMLQDGGLYSTARPLALARHIAALYPAAEDPAALLESLGISPATRIQIRRLSGGEQQRVKCALALVGRPDLVFLDEPTAGLDSVGRGAVHELVRALTRRGGTVVLTTHLMDDVESLADRVVVVADGRALAQGSIDDLAGDPESIRLRVPIGTDVSTLERLLPPGCAVAPIAIDRYAIVGSRGPLAISVAARWCADQGLPSSSLEVGRRSLESVVQALLAARR